MITTAALSMLGGLCMVGFYSWNVSTVDCGTITPPPAGARGNWENDPDLCNYHTIHPFSNDYEGLNPIKVINSCLFCRLLQVVGVWPPIFCSSFSDVLQLSLIFLWQLELQR